MALDVELTEDEVRTIVAGIDSLARQQQDVIAAGRLLWPLREKLDAAMRKAKESANASEQING